jgi:hypothetical protein
MKKRFIFHISLALDRETGRRRRMMTRTICHFHWKLLAFEECLHIIIIITYMYRHLKAMNFWAVHSASRFFVIIKHRFFECESLGVKQFSESEIFTWEEGERDTSERERKIYFIKWLMMWYLRVRRSVKCLILLSPINASFIHTAQHTRITWNVN